MRGDAKAFEAYQVREKALMSTDKQGGENLAYREEILAQLEGYKLKTKAPKILEGLGLGTSIHEQQMSTLSGGFKLRVLLA